MQGTQRSAVVKILLATTRDSTRSGANGSSTNGRRPEAAATRSERLSTWRPVPEQIRRCSHLYALACRGISRAMGWQADVVWQMRHACRCHNLVSWRWQGVAAISGVGPLASALDAMLLALHMTCHSRPLD
jgi:hypothetical protein